MVKRGGRPAWLLVMEFRVLVLADPSTSEEDLRMIIRRSKSLIEGFRLTAASIFPEGVECALQVFDEEEEEEVMNA